VIQSRREKQCWSVGGGSLKKDTAPGNLVKNAKKVIALEGCLSKCFFNLTMKGVKAELKPEIIVAYRLYEFDKNEKSKAQIKEHAQTVAQTVANTL